MAELHHFPGRPLWLPVVKTSFLAGKSPDVHAYLNFDMVKFISFIFGCITMILACPRHLTSPERKTRAIGVTIRFFGHQMPKPSGCASHRIAGDRHIGARVAEVGQIPRLGCYNTLYVGAADDRQFLAPGGTMHDDWSHRPKKKVMS